jgi:hypothetical protein
MFSEEEIEALVLGSRWVAERADAPLSEAARNALAKIVAVLPDDMRDGADATGLLVGPGAQPEQRLIRTCTDAVSGSHWAGLVFFCDAPIYRTSIGGHHDAAAVLLCCGDHSERQSHKP